MHNLLNLRSAFAKIRIARLSLIFLVAGAIGSNGQIITTQTEVTGSTNGDGTTIVAESTNGYGTNLALGATLSASNFSPYPGSGISYLNDGSLGTFVNNDYTGADTTVSTASEPWTLTLNLDTSVNTAGYTIYNIKVVSGWDRQFVNQNFSFAFSTDGTTFTPVSGPYTLDNSRTGTYVTLQTSLTGTAGAALATNVKALQLTFTPEDSAINGAHLAAYKEVEIFGSPSDAVAAPEPSTYIMLLSGLAALALMRNRGSKVARP